MSKATVAQRAGCVVRARSSEAHYLFNHATHLSLDAFPLRQRFSRRLHRLALWTWKCESGGETSAPGHAPLLPAHPLQAEGCGTHRRPWLQTRVLIAVRVRHHDCQTRDAMAAHARTGPPTAKKSRLRVRYCNRGTCC